MLYKELYDIIVSLREQLRLSIIDAAQNEAEANDLRAEVERDGVILKQLWEENASLKEKAE